MNMHRARRLASAAVVASLAVTALSACRSQPNVAAYLGNDSRITEARVQSVWDEAKTAATATPVPGQDGQPAPFSLQRADIVRVLVSAPVLDQVAKNESVTLPAQLNLAAAAQETGIPDSTEYAREYAHVQTLLGLLRQKAQNAPAPSDADLRQVFDGLLANGLATGDFNSFKSSLSGDNATLVRSSVAVRNEINQVVTPLDIRINPRYGDLGVSVLDAQTQSGATKPLIVAPFDPSASPAPVTDQS